MRSSLKFTNKLNMISEMENESKFQILEYDKLNGAQDIKTVINMNSIRNSGMKLKQVRIILDNSSIKINLNSFSYMKGNIEKRNKFSSILNFGKKIIASKMKNENLVRSAYSGRGEIFLEPSFSNFALLDLEDDEIIVCDNMFCACEETIELETLVSQNIASTLVKNSNLVQLRIEGSGIVALKIPVPENEIFKCILINDTLKVKGNLAILRTGNIEYSIEKNINNASEASINNEGFINVYKGTGEVWLTPTINIYDDLNSNFIKENIQYENYNNMEEEL